MKTDNSPRIRLAANIAGVLLGALFLFASVGFFLMMRGIVPAPPPPPEGSPPALFMGALVPTGYLTFIKVLEVAGALLVAIPKTRNLGLLVLGPIIVNILAFHLFVTRSGVFDPMVVAICLLAAFLLWCGRRSFAGLLN